MGSSIKARSFRLAIGSSALLSYLFLYAPIVVLIVFSFNASQLALVWEGFSLQWYVSLLEDRVLIDALLSSVLIAFTTSLFATLFGTLFAVAARHMSAPKNKLLDALVVLPILVPEIVMAVGLLFLFARIVRPFLHFAFGLELSSFVSVTAGHIAFNLSYVVVIVRARLSLFDPHLEEAAAILGASPAQTLYRVVLPMLAPAILSGALLSFSLSLDDFYLSYFASGGGTGFRTLPLHLFGLQAKVGISPQMNAVASVMLLVSLVLAAVSLYLNRVSFRAQIQNQSE